MGNSDSRHSNATTSDANAANGTAGSSTQRQTTSGAVSNYPATGSPSPDAASGQFSQQNTRPTEPAYSPTAQEQQQQQQSQQPGAQASAGPGAFRMAGRTTNQRFYVTIPRGVRPGQHFAVLVNGQQMMVRCPEENRPGERLIVAAPQQQAQQYVVTVPMNVRPGQQFRVMINNQEVMVTCPRGVRPGQRVTFQLPQQEKPQQPTTAPNHQMFEVIVPEGVRSGQPFALIANGQRVMVTCPPNVKPGQKIRFQLPIQLSQQQLEAIKVKYDKDGWMRCLGIDLKFHWVFNTTSSNDASSNGNLAGAGMSSSKEQHRLPFDIDSHAFIRSLLSYETLPPGTPIPKYGQDISFIPAIEYSLDTAVKGTSVSYQEINSVARLPFQQKHEWIKNQFNALRVPWPEGHIKIRVRRSSLLMDTMEAIESIDAADMKKIFRFEFIGEPALDAGGVTREFYTIFCEQLCNPDIGLFLYSSANQMCMQFNPNSGLANEYHLRYFHTFGRILGKSLMDSQITPVHFIQPIYKHIMGWPITLRDLEHIDSEIFRNLMQLLDIDDVSLLDLDFIVTEDHLGITETVELIKDGANITVTNSNISDYLIAHLKYRLHNRFQAALSAFLHGFYDVIPEPLLSVFDFQELELILHGLPNIDMDDWYNNAEYTGEFASNPKSNKVVQWFWEIVRNFEQENKAKLLQFVTGTAGVPVQGFGYLQGNDGTIRKFTIHGDKNVKVFPRAHTCFNRIDMPIYKTKAEMAKYLTLAVSMESSGFDIE